MDIRYMTCMGLAPEHIPHYESWSCPDADTYITGIDYYEHPRLCRQRMNELYPYLGLAVPAEDTPIPRPSTCANDSVGSEPRRRVRWGDGETWEWNWGERMTTSEDVFAFSPLAQADFTDIPVVECRDYSDEDKLYQSYRAHYPVEWGDSAPEGSWTGASFYNTMFMWPLLTFGWELFLETCLDPRFERIMDEFAEISRRVFRVFARLPVNFIICHDDIVTARGPVCSPAWLHKYIYPRYEEFWEMLKSAGKEVIFVADGCMDACADDVFACGARGMFTEPYTDFKAIARKHEDCCLGGEGDNRVLSRNDPEEIRAMVLDMVETGKMTGGYFMKIGNQIPWNLPPEAVKLYLDLCSELAVRREGFQVATHVAERP